MYARRAAGRELTFDFAEGLIQDNLLVVDRETNSVWSQLHGQAVIGPLKGTPLEMIPALQATWKFWRTRHPGTRVMLPPPGTEDRPYYYRDRKPGEPAPATPSTRHDASTVGLGLVIADDAVFFPLQALARDRTPLTTKVGGQPVTVHYDADGLTAWAEDARGELLPTVLAYRDGWLAFFPKSRVHTSR